MADSYDISLVEGANHSIQLTAKAANGTPLNVSGYLGRGYVKKSYSDTGILIDLNPTVYTGANGSAYASGLVDVVISGNMTSGVAAGQYVYDVEIYRGDDNLKLLRGYFNIHPEVAI